MKTYMAIADEHGASILTSMEGTTCPRCGTQVAPHVQHKCGDQADTEIQTQLEGLAAFNSAAKKAGAYPD